MNTIITSLINDSINREQPFLGPSLAFLQASTVEALNNTIIGLIGPGYSTSQVYILFGCVRSGAADNTAGTTTVTSGAVFYNGEIYTVAAFSGTMSSGHYLQSALSITNGSADPVTFSDQSSQNVHNVRQWLLAITTTSTGAGLFNNWISWSGVRQNFTLLNSFTLTAGIPAGYRIDGSGNVWLTGQVNTPGSQTIFATVAALAPKYSKAMTVWAQNQTTVGILTVDNSGNFYATKYDSSAWAANVAIYLSCSYNIND